MNFIFKDVISIEEPNTNFRFTIFYYNKKSIGNSIHPHKNINNYLYVFKHITDMCLFQNYKTIRLG